MTRYYYTCPIKAAYMSEYQGMEFEAIDYKTDISEPLSIEELLDFDYYSACANYPEKNKIYLRKGYEQILFAQVGDIAIDGLFTYLYGKASNEKENRWNSLTIAGQDRVSNEMRIILRNGREFFMPEVEND